MPLRSKVFVLLSVLSFAAVSIPETATAQEPSPPMSNKPPSMVWLHVARSSVSVQQRLTDYDSWTTVCNAPCDKQVSTIYRYRIVGTGLKTSSDFSLLGSHGDQATLEVHGGSEGLFYVGALAIPIGGVSAVLGFAFYLLGSVGGGACTDASCQAGSHREVLVGSTMLGLGALAVLSGIVLVAHNAHARVLQRISTSQSGLPTNDVWKPIPTWRETPLEQRGLSLAVGVPIVAARF
jgi:hypothetical protein